MNKNKLIKLIEALFSDKTFKRFFWNVLNASLAELILILGSNNLRDQMDEMGFVYVFIIPILYGLLNGISKTLNNVYGK